MKALQNSFDLPLCSSVTTLKVRFIATKDA